LVTESSFQGLAEMTLKQGALPISKHNSSSGTPGNWTSPTPSTSSPSSAHSQVPQRISYRIQPLGPYNNSFNPWVRCVSSSQHKRVDLDPAMKQAKGILDFGTAVETDLKILFMGDSVSIQFSEEFEYATNANIDLRRVYRESWRGHEGLHVSAPVRGGGVVAGWRITHFFMRDRVDMPLPNSGGGGWSKDDVDLLLNHTYGPDNSTKVGALDVLVFRIPFGWIKFEDIVTSKMEETLALAYSQFGVSTAIFVGQPFVNNVMTADDIVMLEEKNKLIRNFTASWNGGHQGQGHGVKHVLFLDFGTLADALLEWHARLIGYDTSNTSYLMDNMGGCCPGKGFVKSIAQLCGEKVTHGSLECNGNMMSYDGTHWCMETFGGRFDAGIACLLGCVYNHETVDRERVRSCEKDCNDRYMSLQPVELSPLS
jgi:hypothetical protein